MLADGASLPFDLFMERALYDSAHGYYAQSPKSIIGVGGDFYTASQLQPLFGAVIAFLLPEGPVLELGPGHGEMRAAFSPREYRAVELGDSLPATWTGGIFANEFFDALPVTAGVTQNSELYELLVQREGSTHRWTIGAPLTPERRQYVERFYPELPDGFFFEIAERAVRWIRRLSECLTRGTVLIVDYGWSGNEYLHHPGGTLMSYRRHTASFDVLASPGSRDITAHVPFPALMEEARRCGFSVLRFETLAQAVLRVVERNQRLLALPRAQAHLKTLLFSMGESFRVLTLHKEGAK